MCGSTRRSFENPGLRRSSGVSVSKYKVVTSYKRNDPGPIPACVASAWVIISRKPSVAYSGSFILIVAYPADVTPTSASVSIDSSLEPGWIIRARTTSRNTVSPPQAASRPIRSKQVAMQSNRIPARSAVTGTGLFSLPTPASSDATPPRSRDMWSPSIIRCACAFKWAYSRSVWAEPTWVMFFDPCLL